jgi:hypothetical protein
MNPGGTAPQWQAAGAGDMILATPQTVTGLKSHTAGIVAYGGAVNLNENSNNATNINTGTSTGTITIGGSGTQTIDVGNGAGIKTVNVGSDNTTSTTTLLSGSGGLNLNVDNNQNTNINTGTSTGTVNIGTGIGANDVNIATGGSGSVFIGNSSSSTSIESATTTIGIAGTTSGDGIRIGNARITLNKPSAPPAEQTGNYSPTVGEILDAGILGFTGNSPKTITMPTAANLIQALPGTPVVGDVFTFYVYSENNGAVSFATGVTGVTIENNSSISGGTSRVIYCRVTNVGSGTEAISIY